MSAWSQIWTMLFEQVPWYANPVALSIITACVTASIAVIKWTFFASADRATHLAELGQLRKDFDKHESEANEKFSRIENRLNCTHDNMLKALADIARLQGEMSRINGREH